MLQVSRMLVVTGIGFHHEQTVIEARIDGITLHHGPVFTDNVNAYDLRGSPLGAYPVFAWQEDLDYDGHRQLEIHCRQGAFLYTGVVANYGPLSLTVDPCSFLGLGPEWFISAYHEQRPDGVYRDPLTDVTIDDVATQREPIHQGQRYGPWSFGITHGQILRAKVLISAGINKTWENPEMMLSDPDMVHGFEGGVAARQISLPKNRGLMWFHTSKS